MSGPTSGLVSIAVPTYNRGPHCVRAVRSALQQSHSNVEVLVVDDGSTDDTRELLSDLDPRVRYFRQENAGVGAARNRALNEARGEFVAFLDSDDVFMPWKLEAQLSVLRAYPEAGMVWTNMAAVDEDGQPLYPTYLRRMYPAYRHVDLGDWLSRGRRVRDVWESCPPGLAERRCAIVDLSALILMGNLVHTSTVVLRRERQQAVGLFDTSMRAGGEDYDYHLRTCRLGPVAYLDVSSILYRIGAHDQLTDERNDVHFARSAFTTVNRTLEEAGGDVGLSRAMLRKRFARLHYFMGKSQFFRDRSEARRHLVKSLWRKPWSYRTARLLAASFLPDRVLSRTAAYREHLRQLSKEG